MTPKHGIKLFLLFSRSYDETICNVFIYLYLLTVTIGGNDDDELCHRQAHIQLFVYLMENLTFVGFESKIKWLAHENIV